jgi:hypothetical protein
MAGTATAATDTSVIIEGSSAVIFVENVVLEVLARVDAVFAAGAEGRSGCLAPAICAT